MTTYTFVPSAATTQVAWSDPSVWSGGVAPNDPGADVVVPAATRAASGGYYVSDISLSGAYAVHSLSIAENELSLGGALTIGADLSLSTGGEIDLQPGASLTTVTCTNDGLDIQGAGQITCSWLFQNQSAIVGSGLALTAANLTNTGELAAGAGGLTVTVTPGGFTNLSGSTLTGGTYAAGSASIGAAVLDMNVGGVATIDAAKIALDAGGEIAFWDSAKGAYLPIEATLQGVAASGTLALGPGVADSWGALSVDGLLQLAGAAPTFSQLTVDAGGRAGGAGSLSGPIVDNGTIFAGQNGAGGALTVAGPVSGSGTLEIETALVVNGRAGPQYAGASLELASTCSATVAFRDGRGALILDSPSGFSGRIAPTGGGDQIVLEGIASSSATGWSYSGDRNGGTLDIGLGGGSHLRLNFAGDFNAQGFSLAAGPQAQPSAPPSLVITSLGPAIPAQDLLRDHFNGAHVSDILIANTTGAVVVGQVSGGVESYTAVAGLGPEWAFRGTGDFLGDGQSGFLIENTGGAVDLGEVSGGRTAYTQVAALGPEWRFVGTGDFFGVNQGIASSTPGAAPVGGSQDQMLIENTIGLLELATVLNGRAVYTQVDQLGSDWKVLGAGAFLGDGRAQFLMENGAGLVEVGDVQNSKAVYTPVAALGPEWRWVGSGDVFGDDRAQFLIESTSGALAAGEVGADGKAYYTLLAGIGPEWTVESFGDYLGEGRDQLVMKNNYGAVVIGDWSGGQIHWTQVGQLGPEWSFHG